MPNSLRYAELGMLVRKLVCGLDRSKQYSLVELGERLQLEGNELVFALGFAVSCGLIPLDTSLTRFERRWGCNEDKT